MATRPRLATTNERIAILEEKDAKREEQLEAIVTKLDDVYTLLIQAKGVIWLGTKVAGVITLVCVVIGAVVAVLKYLHG